MYKPENNLCSLYRECWWSSEAIEKYEVEQKMAVVWVDASEALYENEHMYMVVAIIKKEPSFKPVFPILESIHRHGCYFEGLKAEKLFYVNGYSNNLHENEITIVLAFEK